MLGSSNSISCANIMLNASVAESLRVFADVLEPAAKEGRFEEALHTLIQKTIREHKNIMFNGNGYDDAWIKEATEVRGLLNYRTTADCLPHLMDEKNVKMLTSHKVFTEAEMKSRLDITLENYCKTVIIEANTMVDMAKKQILPAVTAYAASLASSAAAKKDICPDAACKYETSLISKLSLLADTIAEKTAELEAVVVTVRSLDDIVEQADAIRDKVLAKMGELRAPADEAEGLVAEEFWPYPTYGDLLFGVK